MEGFLASSIAVGWKRFYASSREAAGPMLKRFESIALLIEDEEVVDLDSLLRGELECISDPRILVLSPASGEPHELSIDDLRCLLRYSPREARPWAPEDRDSPERLTSLLAIGLLREVGLSEGRGESDEDDITIAGVHWHPLAYFFYFWNQHKEAHLLNSSTYDVRTLRETAREDAESFLDRFGPPPPLFSEEFRDRDRVELPDWKRNGGELPDLLLGRRTFRAFDQSEPIELGVFSSILGYCFGCQGLHRISEGFSSAHKTSPSGGSLHPIEAYPIVRNVAGIDSGIYHYDPASHSLEQLQAADADELGSILFEMAQGQAFVGESHVAVILAARFERNYWKYRNRMNTFMVIMKDAGHLSQTFYLVSRYFHLGSYYTGSIGADAILRHLGLERVSHGPIGICGCGPISPDGDPTLLPLVPYRFEDAR
ncbi:MAG: putative peptide maturation dehydrogenase [Holophagales bacterium]|nr:putative peptide maturation dehydrogenase [Holophagales bacterium]